MSSIDFDKPITNLEIQDLKIRLREKWITKNGLCKTSVTSSDYENPLIYKPNYISAFENRLPIVTWTD